MSLAKPPSPSPLQLTLLELWRRFDGTPVPGLWVGRLDAFVLPELTDVDVRVSPDAVGLEARADLYGVAEVEGERYAWIGVIHRGAGPANVSDVDRLFDAASAELANALGELDGVVPWLMSVHGVTVEARARLLEAGALFSNGEDVAALLKAFEIPAPSGELSA